MVLAGDDVSAALQQLPGTSTHNPRGNQAAADSLLGVTNSATMRGQTRTTNLLEMMSEQL